MSFEHILAPPRRLQYAFNKIQPENMKLRILKRGGNLYSRNLHFPVDIYSSVLNYSLPMNKRLSGKIKGGDLLSNGQNWVVCR